MVNMFMLSISLMMTMLVGLSTGNSIVLVLSMEVSLFCFIFMIYNYKLITYSSPSVKYFLVQTVGSMVLLLYILTHDLLQYGFFNTGMLLFGLSIKLGIFPLHFWVVPTTSELSFSMIGVLGIPMKVLPLALLFSELQNNLINQLSTIAMYMGLGSMFMGMFLGVKNKSLRGVLGASSVSHTGWLLYAMTSMNILMYFMLYSLTLVCFLWGVSSMDSGVASLSLYAMAGLPPFPIFFGKLLVLLSLYKLNFPPHFLIFALLSAVLSLIYYLKFMFTFYLSSMVSSKKWVTGVVLFFSNMLWLTILM
uniref:NADH-ubiquinone oxidoreductase chain 2 n=1 Tax=Aegista diversifamilia TaxID=1545397 RepID=A0A0U2DWE6_AEGDI|nr:NADH dehydrogenase subunit 2 [Aegista diversifamilia]AKP55337.1 NADH dehydrogenase subunit 2 [Aegista diversifamilia]